MRKHYKISKGLELPKSGRHFGKLIDLSKMEVGGSFTFPPVDGKRVEAMIHEYGRKNGCAFLINLNDVGTCWRTA